MIWHVYQQAAKARLDQLIVATDDERILKSCYQYKIPCEMTDPAHNTGTDRVAEIATRYPQFKHIVNIQGDQPLIPPALIKRVAQTTRDVGVDMASARRRISCKVAQSPHVVKVVTDNNDNALYFSRNPIPYFRNGVKGSPTYWQHIGIYGYTRDALLQITSFEQSFLEISESLEQLRALSNGIAIRMVETSETTVSVDTWQDLEYIRTLF